MKFEGLEVFPINHSSNIVQGFLHVIYGLSLDITLNLSDLFEIYTLCIEYDVQDSKKIRKKVLASVDAVNTSDIVRLDNSLIGIHNCGKVTNDPLMSQLAVKALLRHHEKLSFEFEKFPKSTLVDMFTEIRSQLVLSELKKKRRLY